MPVRPIVALLVALVVGCSGSSSDAGGSAGGDDAGGGGSGAGSGATGTDGGGASPLPSGAMKAGWQRAFSASPAAITCAMGEPELTAAKATALTIGDSTLYVGYEQAGQNQNPVFARFDGGTKRYCEHHEQEPPDGRAYGVTWDGGDTAYVVYTIVGGGSAFDAKAKGKWQDRYGDGGGSSKVVFVGDVDANAGTLRYGTFSIAKKQDGKTNSHKPTDAVLVLDDGRVELHGDSAFQPVNPDRTIMTCTAYPFLTKIVLSPDLASASCSSATNCTAKTPCE